MNIYEKLSRKPFPSMELITVRVWTCFILIINMKLWSYIWSGSHRPDEKWTKNKRVLYGTLPEYMHSPYSFNIFRLEFSTRKISRLGSLFVIDKKVNSIHFWDKFIFSKAYYWIIDIQFSVICFVTGFVTLI